jgi:hypothetical protein
VNIPDITIGEGLLIDVARAQFEEKLRAACGGELCLRVEVEERSDTHETCRYSGDTDPAGGTSVLPDTTVVLIAGTLPCTDANDKPIPDDQETTDEPTDEPTEEPTDESTTEELDDGTAP